MDEEPPLPPPPPPFKESDIPIFSTHITLSRDTHNIWTRGRTFNRQSYFTVLTALQALEAKMKKCRTPELYEREERKMRQAFEYLEKLVLEYLFSDEAEDDWEKFELLRNPDHTTKNERMRRALEARLEETKEELRTKEVMIDLRTWRRNETIEQKWQERARREAEEERKASAKRLEEQMWKPFRAYCGVALL